MQAKKYVEKKHKLDGWLESSVKSVCSQFQEAKEPSHTHILGGLTHCPSGIFFFFLLGNRMISVPTGMPVDAACLKEGEEMQSELRGTCG